MPRAPGSLRPGTQAPEHKSLEFVPISARPPPARHPVPNIPRTRSTPMFHVKHRKITLAQGTPVRLHFPR